MINPNSESYYERLGLELEATDDQIKAAFFKAVRQHPPEKDPDNYKLIREAYDTLSNAQSRQEYDSRRAYGPEIDALEQELQDASDVGDIQSQIRSLKKLIIMLPEVGIHRNRLGLVFMENEMWEEALAQFAKAITIDKRNPTYVLNRGHAHEQASEYSKAESMFERAWNLAPEDYAAPRALASLYYYSMEKKKKAHQVLDKAILADEKVDFQDFFCMHDKIMFFVFDRNESAVKKEMERIASVVTSPEDGDFAAYTFGSMALQLMQFKGFKMAQTLANAALRFNPEDEYLQKLAANSTKLGKLERQVDEILARKDFPDPIKFMIATLWAVNFGDEDDPEVEKQKNEVFNVLPNMMDVEPYSSDILQAVDIIQQRYPAVWEWQDTFWGHL